MGKLRQMPHFGDDPPVPVTPPRARAKLPSEFAEIRGIRGFLRTHLLNQGFADGRGGPGLGSFQGGREMAQRHMDRLSSFDTSFLANEKDNAHMAIGAIL